MLKTLQICFPPYIQPDKPKSGRRKRRPYTLRDIIIDAKEQTTWSGGISFEMKHEKKFDALMEEIS